MFTKRELASAESGSCIASGEASIELGGTHISEDDTLYLRRYVGGEITHCFRAGLREVDEVVVVGECA